uniref:FHA domain-containing protein n=1 Tax=Steinernema glaseri TaxID=37863 RepID=A0A1I7ZEZ4_9BILA
METLPLDKTIITIGSGPDCDIIIPDPHLAQKHAEIEYHPLPQAYFLKDLDTLSGTTFNGEPVFGMVELKPNNTIRFGYGPEYVFEVPKSAPKGNIRKVWTIVEVTQRPVQINKGHENCLTPKETLISLPIKKILPALAAKQYAHPPPRPRKVRLSMDDNSRAPSEEKEKRSFLTTERLSPITRVRSASMDPNMAKNYRNIFCSHFNAIPLLGGKKSENGRIGPKSDLSKSYGMTSPTSSANSSAEMPANRRNTVLGTPINCRLQGQTIDERILDDYTLSTNNRLLQRVVRLQMELHRRDLEINQLRERVLQNATSQEPRPESTFPYCEGPQVDTHKHIVNCSRSPSEVLLASPSAFHKSFPPNAFDPAQSRSHEMEIEVSNDFLKLLAKSMQKLNERLLTFPMRDYADIFSEMTRCLIDPLSCTIAEAQKHCLENISKRYLLISERQVAQHLLEKYVQESVQPLVRQIEMILPVVRDAAMIARESVKVCTVFTAWSREFGDEIRTNGLTSSMLLHKADALLSRFKENSLGKHWLPPSLTPLLRVASLEFRKRIESRTVSAKETASAFAQTDVEREEIHPKPIKVVPKEIARMESVESTVKSVAESTAESFVDSIDHASVKHEMEEEICKEATVEDVHPERPEQNEQEQKEPRVEEKEDDSSVEDCIHSTSTVAPSVCSSQKTSTDTEQLEHLHEMARNITRDVFQNLELQENKHTVDEEEATRLNGSTYGEASATDTPPSTPVEQISESPAIEIEDFDAIEKGRHPEPVEEENGQSLSSPAPPSLPSEEVDQVIAHQTPIAVVVKTDEEEEKPEKEDDPEEELEDDLPLPKPVIHASLGEGLVPLNAESDSLSLDYISTVRSDAPSRLTHRSEHHSELDEVEHEGVHPERKASSEFWRLATNLGRALALEHEIHQTRAENLKESEKRASVMESLMTGIHEILENIKTEHEKLGADVE